VILSAGLYRQHGSRPMRWSRQRPISNGGRDEEWFQQHSIKMSRDLQRVVPDPCGPHVRLFSTATTRISRRVGTCRPDASYLNFSNRGVNRDTPPPTISDAGDRVIVCRLNYANVWRGLDSDLDEHGSTWAFAYPRVARVDARLRRPRIDLESMVQRRPSSLLR